MYTREAYLDSAVDRWTPDRRSRCEAKKEMGVLSLPTGPSPSGRKKFCTQQPRAQVNPKGTVQWKKLKIWGQEPAPGDMLALLFLFALWARLHVFTAPLPLNLSALAIVNLPVLKIFREKVSF